MFTRLLVAGALVLAFASPAVSQTITITPGDSYEFVGGSPEAVDPDCAAIAPCVASVGDLSGPNVRMYVGTQMPVGALNVTKTATIRLLNFFQTSPLGEHVLPARIIGNVSWRGYLAADFGVLGNESTANFAASIYELENNDVQQRKLVARQTLLSSSISANIAKIPVPKFDREIGSSAVNLGFDMVRGKLYMLAIEATARSSSGAVGISTASVFANTELVPGVPLDDGFIQVSPMLLRVQPDFLELIENLGEEFRHHTHVYLTGKGVGHNNTEAVTSGPIDSTDAPSGSDLGDLGVPDGAPITLEGARPNPTTGDCLVQFTLAGVAPASLGVYDVAGRLLVSRDVGQLGPGPHALALEEAKRLPAGVYMVRLAQGAAVRTTTFTLVR